MPPPSTLFATCPKGNQMTTAEKNHAGYAGSGTSMAFTLGSVSITAVIVSFATATKAGDNGAVSAEENTKSWGPIDVNAAAKVACAT